MGSLGRPGCPLGPDGFGLRRPGFQPWTRTLRDTRPGPRVTSRTPPDCVTVVKVVRPVGRSTLTTVAQPGKCETHVTGSPTPTTFLRSKNGEPPPAART